MGLRCTGSATAGCGGCRGRAGLSAVLRPCQHGADPGTPSGRLETTNRSRAMTHVEAAQVPSAHNPKALYGGTGTRRITVRDIAAAKHRGEKWPMLTAYDA